MLGDCIFCKIAAGDIPAQAVAQDDEFFAFPDLHPLAPVHVLVIPRRHLASLDDVDQLGDDGAGRLLRFIAATARAAGVAGTRLSRDQQRRRRRGPGGHASALAHHRRAAAGRHGMRELGTIEQRIKDDATQALRDGDKQRRGALSSFVAALKKERIDSRREPTEADELVVLKRERKRRAEALEVYEQAGRTDLADQERYEEELLGLYMPQELGEAELQRLVDEAIADTGAAIAQGHGQGHEALMPKVAGRADGKLLSTMVRRAAGSLSG